jgi:DNA-binding SARP family transcriptional activator
LPDSRLRLLGGFDLRSASGAARPPLPRKLQGLLAVLALREGEPLSRDHLASLLWGRSDAERARQSLRQAFTTLRALLPAAAARGLRTTPQQASLEAGSLILDVREFEAALGRGGPEGLRQAAALDRGELLEGLNLDEPMFDEWLAQERTRLRALSLKAREALLDEELRSLNHAGAIDAAERLLAADPAHEPAHRALMRSYAAQGRRDLALRQYRACAEALRRVLDVAPDANTDALLEELRNARLPAARPGRRSVLIVEDEPVTRAMLHGLLDEAGYDAVSAADGADALLLLGARRFDLVVSDLRMPLLDGFKLLEIVRSKGARLPVIVVAGGAGGAEQQALALGAADFIPKPIEREALLHRVRNAIDTARR